MLLKNRKRMLSVRAGCLAIATSIVVGSSASNAHGQVTYRVHDLGVLYPSAGYDSEAYDISNQNHVVGWSDQLVEGPLTDNTRKRAFLWMPKGSVPSSFPEDLTAGLNDLRILAGMDPELGLSQAFAIIRNGTEVRITGQSSYAPGGVHGFFWEPIEFSSDPNERLIDIGTIDDSGHSEGQGIAGSDPYYVVGKSVNGNSCYMSIISSAFLWNSATEDMIELAPAGIPVNTFSIAYDVRVEPGNQTLIAGGANICNTETSCPYPTGDVVAWTNLNESWLLQPAGFGEIAGEARDLNDAGNLVGWGTDPNNDCRDRPLYWEDTAAVGVILETVPVGHEGRALGMNSNKDVVGANDADAVAVIWKSTGPGTWSYSDLNDLIPTIEHKWTLKEARAINDNGWIVGYGTRQFESGDSAFLLRPITTCLHDLDGDGQVSTSDLLILLASWGPCPDDAGQSGEFCDADYNFNGEVTTSDLLELLATWGPCGTASQVPQGIQDCLNRYCCDPEDLLALEKCLCTFDPDCDPAP